MHPTRSRLPWRLLAAMLLMTAASVAFADDWPQWLGPKRDGVWREDGILAKFPAGGPKVLWRAEVGGGFSGPAVAEGRVVILDRQGEVLAKGKEAPPKAGLKGKERVVGFDAATGKQLWAYEYDCDYRINYTSGPRATAVIDAGKVYGLGAMGDVTCLDAAKGTLHWQAKLTELSKTKPPVWGYAAHPLVD